MRKHLARKVRADQAKPRLKDMDPAVLPAAWSILRWLVLAYPFLLKVSMSLNNPLTYRCVASCTAYLEEITSGEELIKNLGTSPFVIPLATVEHHFAHRSWMEAISL